MFEALQPACHCDTHWKAATQAVLLYYVALWPTHWQAGRTLRLALAGTLSCRMLDSSCQSSQPHYCDTAVA